MPDDKRVRIDLNQSIRSRLIERYGPTLGKTIAQAIQQCIADGKRGKDLKDCIQTRFKEKLDKENVEEIYALMSHWETVG